MGFWKSNEEREIMRQERELDKAQRKAEYTEKILSVLNERLSVELQSARDRAQAHHIREKIRNPDAEFKRHEGVREDEREEQGKSKEKEKRKRSYY